MAETRRKTTLEERREIVSYCISHNLAYKVWQQSMMFPTARFIPR